MADFPGGARAGPGTASVDQEEDSVWEAGGLRCADWGDVQVWGDLSVHVIEGEGVWNNEDITGTCSFIMYV